MLKITTGSYNFFKKTRSNPRLKNRVCYDLDHLDTITDPVAFKEVVSAMQLNNGTFKTTTQNRFDDLDEKLLANMASKKDQSLLIHDMAVSDGVTSLQLFERLEKNGFQFKLTASDHYNKVMIDKRWGGLIKRVYDTDGLFLNGAWFRIFADHKLSGKFSFSQKLGERFKRKTRNEAKEKEILLINPSLRFSEAFAKIDFEDYDIFNFKVDQPFDVVRSMNILNRKYFSDEQLTKAIERIYHSMAPGALLLVGKTDKETGVNDASFFTKTASGFEEIEGVNDGSEVKDLVLGFTAG